MNISKLLALGFGFLITVLLAEITLNHLVTKKASEGYLTLKNEVQPTVLMLNRFSSINREFSLLTVNYVNNGGTINRNRINKIIEVEFEHFISEISELRDTSFVNDQKIVLHNQIINETRNLIDLGRVLTEILVTKQDFTNSENVNKAKNLLETSLLEKQENLNNMLEILQYQYNRDMETYQDDLATSLTSVSNTIIVVGVIGILLGIILSFSIIRSISRPIQNLSDGAQQVSTGNYNITVKPVGNNELTRLTHAFNKMAQDLQTSFSKLNDAKKSIQDKREKLTLTLETSEMGTWEWNLLTNELAWDDQMLKLYGVSPEMFTGAYDAWTNGLHPEDRERSEKEIQQAITGEAEFNTNFRVVWPNSEIHHIRATGKVFRDEQGEATRMVGFNWDVTKERELEQEIRENSRIIQEKNKELNEFSYIASHDLQEPINTMSAFSDLLLKQYGEQLDETGKEYLGFIKGSSVRAKELISDLLDYNRLGRERVLTKKNLNELVQDALDDLSGKIRKTNAVIKVEKLPTIKVYESELRLIFQNLVSNAIKFSKKGVVPEISIKAVKEEDLIHFSISDNGIGIHEKYFDTIFAVFKRLHSKSDYPGTGIGLAHCKKIVEMHKGSIWVESSPENGSTFHFTISTQLS